MKGTTFGLVCVYHRQATFIYSQKEDWVFVAETGKNPLVWRKRAE